MKMKKSKFTEAPPVASNINEANALINAASAHHYLK
jgi:hypothetical protein